MDLKNDMNNIKDDVKKGLDKVGDGMKSTVSGLGSTAGKITNVVKNTAMNLKDDVMDMMSDMGNKAKDIKDKIEDMGENGEGIGRLDGYIWFVKDAVIGDVIEAGVTKMKKQYGFARLIRVIEPSEYRTEERCPSARRCGGCQIQAVDYQEQLRLKVYNNLKRIGGLSSLLLPGGEETTEQTKEETERNAVVMEPIIGMENPWRYRNKAQFPFGRNKDGRIVTGFYAGRTHDIVEQEDCLLGVEENREILSIIRNFMEEYKIEPYNEETHRGLVRHVLIRKGFQTGELMVCLVINGRKLPGQQALTERLLEIPGMTSISLNVNQEKTNVILGKELINLWGEGHITDYIGAVQYRISPLSFYQVNPVQTERLYGTALEYAGLTGNETVWDLYCGIGRRQGERQTEPHGKCGILCGEGGGGAAGTVREKPDLCGRDCGGPAQKGMR